MSVPTIEEIRAAADELAAVVLHTPLEASGTSPTCSERPST